MCADLRRGALGFVLLSLPTISFGQSVGLAAAGDPAGDPGYAQTPPNYVTTVPAGYSINRLTFDATVWTGSRRQLAHRDSFAISGR